MITFAAYAIVVFLDDHVTRRRAIGAAIIAALAITVLVVTR